MEFNGWAIDRDYLTSKDEETSAVGYGQTETDAEETRMNPGHLRMIDVRDDLKASEVRNPVRFRLLDDDREVYYGGAVTLEWITEETDAELAYNIDRFGEAFAGATISQFRTKDIPTIHQRHIDLGISKPEDEWLQIYG